MGWMQFIPSSWRPLRRRRQRRRQEGPVQPGRRDLRRGALPEGRGRRQDLRRAIFAYNHADWYVDSVLMRARLIGGLPADLVGSLSGLTQGHFPVHAQARYADDLGEREARRRVARGENAALPVEANASRRGINIFADRAPGGRRPGRQDREGRQHRAAGALRAAARRLRQHLHLRAPEEDRLEGAGAQGEDAEQGVDRPGAVAAEGRRGPDAGRQRRHDKADRPAPRSALQATTRRRPTPAEVAKERLFANPTRPARSTPAAASRSSSPSPRWPRHEHQVLLHRRLRAQPRGRRAQAPGPRPPRHRRHGPRAHRHTSTRPSRRTCCSRSGPPAAARRASIPSRSSTAGSCWSPRRSTAPRARTRCSAAPAPSIGQILLMSKEELHQRVLANPRIELYSCGRRDIEAGVIDRRVLATLEFLASSGLEPTVTSLRCGHGPTRRAATSRTLVGQRRRHREDQRRPDHRQPGRRLDHRPHRPPPAHPPGDAEARADHHAHELRGRGQHARARRPRRPHPPRLPPAVRPHDEGRPARRVRPQALAVDQAHRPPGPDRQPDRQRRPSKYAIKASQLGRASRAHEAE